MTEGQHGFLVAEFENDGHNWKIWHRTEASKSSKWCNFVLEAPWTATPKRKKYFWSGWCHEELRVARTSDMGILAKHYPKIRELLEIECAGAMWIGLENMRMPP